MVMHLGSVGLGHSCRHEVKILSIRYFEVLVKVLKLLFQLPEEVILCVCETLHSSWILLWSECSKSVEVLIVEQKMFSLMVLLTLLIKRDNKTSCSNCLGISL